MSDSDLIDLYSGKILELAASIPHTSRLVEPDATAKRRSPLCGSTISVDLNIVDGRVSEFGQDVKACALGQAAASVVGANILGQDHPAVQRTLAELKAMLLEEGPVPADPFDGLNVLLPAKSFKNRHASILLSLQAIDDAFTAYENMIAN